jgi:hypothetical protein
LGQLGSAPGGSAKRIRLDAERFFFLHFFALCAERLCFFLHFFFFVGFGWGGGGETGTACGPSASDSSTAPMSRRARTRG